MSSVTVDDIVAVGSSAKPIVIPEEVYKQPKSADEETVMVITSPLSKSPKLGE